MTWHGRRVPKLQDGQARRVRQVDVAREAGVSQATVSMVLGERGAPDHRTTEETRRRVREVAERLGYSVNPVARKLVGGRNRLIGVYTFDPIFSAEGRDYYRESWGIEHAAELAGYDLLLFSSAAVPGQRRTIYAGGVNRLSMADGSILLGRHDDKPEIERLCADGFPFVYIGRRELSRGEMSYVTADYTTATAEVVRHLARLGHRSLAYVGTGEASEPEIDRQAGWATACRALAVQRAEVFRPTATEAGPTLTELHERGFTAVLLEQPSQALELVAGAREAGLEIPGDLSVAVLGDAPSALVGDPGWTGFQIPHEAMGRTAVAMLLELLDDPDRGPRHQCLPCTFQPGTTAGPSAEMEDR